MLFQVTQCNFLVEMPRLSVSDRHELINLHLSGLSNRKIGRRLKCDEKTVRMTVKKH